MKILVILPLLAMLSACSTTDNTQDKFSSNKRVVIEDKGQREVEAVVGEQSSFKWEESDETPVVEVMPKKEVESVVTALKTTGTKFTLYFDFNATKVNEETTQEIIKHVQLMQENPQIRLRLEGHADARGTREYNLALAENRALRIKKIMNDYESVSGRITVISYGEERPSSQLNNEAGWQQNRRVEFIYE